MLIEWLLSIKSLPNLLFGVLCLPGDQSHPFAQPTINPLACCICWAGLWVARFFLLGTKARILGLIKAIVFPVVMYGCERWTIKKAECQRIDAFELWCWKRLLRVPRTARRSNQSILKEIGPEYLLEGLMLKLKLQYFGYLM